MFNSCYGSAGSNAAHHYKHVICPVTGNEEMVELCQQVIDIIVVFEGSEYGGWLH